MVTYLAPSTDKYDHMMCPIVRIIYYYLRADYYLQIKLPLKLKMLKSASGIQKYLISCTFCLCYFSIELKLFFEFADE